MKGRFARFQAAGKGARGNQVEGDEKSADSGGLEAPFAGALGADERSHLSGSDMTELGHFDRYVVFHDRDDAEFGSGLVRR